MSDMAKKNTTGPLSQQFAQVEAGLKARQRGTGSTRNTEPALAALSEIERRVQEMEQIVLSASLVGVVCPECGTDDDTYWRGGMTSSWECPCEGVIFTPDHPALPASGEKGEE